MYIISNSKQMNLIKLRKKKIRMQGKSLSFQNIDIVKTIFHVYIRIKRAVTFYE